MLHHGEHKKVYFNNLNATISTNRSRRHAGGAEGDELRDKATAGTSKVTGSTSRSYGEEKPRVME